MRKSMLGVIGLLFLATGCNSNQSQFGIAGVNSADAHRMNASRSAFESSEDPPLTAETHFAAGQFSETQGDFATAIKQYESALKLNPQHAASLYRLGTIYSQLKQYPRSIESWNRYLAATNNSAVGYNNIAYCQELAGDPAAAEISYKKGIARDPKSQPCRIDYGLMLARHGRIDEAKEQFSAVLPEAKVHYNLASVYEQQGKKDLARTEYAEALKADPRFFDAQSRLAGLDKN